MKTLDVVRERQGNGQVDERNKEKVRGGGRILKLTI